MDGVSDPIQVTYGTVYDSVWHTADFCSSTVLQHCVRRCVRQLTTAGGSCVLVLLVVPSFTSLSFFLCLHVFFFYISLTVAAETFLPTHFRNECYCFPNYYFPQCFFPVFIFNWFQLKISALLSNPWAHPPTCCLVLVILSYFHNNTRDIVWLMPPGAAYKSSLLPGVPSSTVIVAWNPLYRKGAGVTPTTSVVSWCNHNIISTV